MIPLSGYCRLEALEQEVESHQPEEHEDNEYWHLKTFNLINQFNHGLKVVLEAKFILSLAEFSAKGY